MADVKVTKKMVLEALIKEFEGREAQYEVEGGVVTAEDVIAYAEKTIEQMADKAEKAKARAKAKRAEADELTTAVLDALTDEYQTRDAILAAVADFEEVTQAKVTARLTKLVKAGEAHKVDLKTEDGRKVKGYALGAAPAEAEEAEDAE